MKKYNVVILGATGAVGIEFRKILLERNFPVDQVRFLGSSSVGRVVDFGDRQVTVEAVDDGCFDGFQIALFSESSISPSLVSMGRVILKDSFPDLTCPIIKTVCQICLACFQRACPNGTPSHPYHRDSNRQS